MLFSKSRVLPFQTKIPGNKGVKFVMQTDGNLVLKDAKGQALWESGTKGKGKGPYKLVLHKGTRLLVIGNGAIIWASDNRLYK